MPTKISDLPVGVAGDLDADARFVFDDLTSGTTKQVSAAVLAEAFAGEDTPLAALGDNTNIDISDGNYHDIASAVIADVAVGDLFEVDAYLAVTQNSGATKTFQAQVLMGSMSTANRLVLSVQASASLRPMVVRFRLAVVSTAEVVQVGESLLGFAGGDAVSGTASASTVLLRDTVDVTGAQTLAFRMSTTASSSAGTQMVRPRFVTIRRVTAS